MKRDSVNIWLCAFVCVFFAALPLLLVEEKRQGPPNRHTQRVRRGIADKKGGEDSSPPKGALPKLGEIGKKELPTRCG